MITSTIRAGESYSIGFFFTNYNTSTMRNLSIYAGGVLIGDYLAGTLVKNGIYYTAKLSSDETYRMRGYRDLIVVLNDNSFGVKKKIVSGLSIDRLSDEVHTPDENNGYNMLVEIILNLGVITSNVELINAIKGEKGDRGEDGSSSIVIEEVPIGAIDGINQIYELSQTPTGKEVVFFYVNGINREDFILSGRTVTLSFAPATGSLISVTYFKIVSLVSISINDIGDLQLPAVTLSISKQGMNGLVFPQIFK